MITIIGKTVTYRWNDSFKRALYEKVTRSFNLTSVEPRLSPDEGDLFPTFHAPLNRTMIMPDTTAAARITILDGGLVGQLFIHI